METTPVVRSAADREAIRQRFLSVDTSNVADVLDTLGLLHQGLSSVPLPPIPPRAASSQAGHTPFAARCRLMNLPATRTRCKPAQGCRQAMSRSGAATGKASAILVS
jgi:hypothetical protein